MRGRKAVPDSVQALKGNPSKRRLQLERSSAGEPEAIGTGAAAAAVEEKPARTRVEFPGFLTAKREREIFRRVVDDYVQTRIARSPDLTAYGRWAYYLHRWCLLKEGLEKKRLTYETKSKHGKLLRKHPDFVALLDLERVLQSLEDRLGLNPVARQNYLRGLSALPPALADLFAHDDSAESADGEPAQPGATPTPKPPSTPLNFLQAGSSKLPN